MPQRGPKTIQCIGVTNLHKISIFIMFWGPYIKSVVNCQEYCLIKVHYTVDIVF